MNALFRFLANTTGRVVRIVLDCDWTFVSPRH